MSHFKKQNIICFADEDYWYHNPQEVNEADGIRARVAEGGMRHQEERRESHVLHCTRSRTDVARMAGAYEDDAYQ